MFHEWHESDDKVGREVNQADYFHKVHEVINHATCLRISWHWIKKLISLIISSINWNYEPNDFSGLFAKYDPRLCHLEDTQVTQAS